MPTSLSKDPKTKGAYLRRMLDIDRTLQVLNLDAEPDHIRFIMGYLACEKAAAVMQGMHQGVSSKALDVPKFKVFSGKIIQACKHFGFAIDDTAIHTIFDTRPAVSARTLRNDFFHDMGPSHLHQIQVNCAKMIPHMKKFLGCIKVVEEWIKANGT